MLKRKFLIVLVMLILLCGCGDASAQIWNIVVDEQTLLATDRGKVIWQGMGEAVRNQWGNFVVTDWHNEIPTQMLISQTGKILLQCDAQEQLMQLSEQLIAVQKNGGHWQLDTPQGESYGFNRADIQQNGEVLLCGLSAGGSVLLSPEGKEISRFSQEILWASNELSNWYETPDGDGTRLLNRKGETVYRNVERMVGQGRVLLKEGQSYRVVDVETGQELYRGDKNWRLYLDNLQLEQMKNGVQVEMDGRAYTMDFVKSWHAENQPAYYIGTGSEIKMVWDKAGTLLFACPAVQWLEIAANSRIATLEGSCLKMLDEAGSTLWQREGYLSSFVVHTGKITVLCATEKQSNKIDVFSLEGEEIFLGLDEIYDITEQGISARKGELSGILNWDGKWVHHWKNSAAESTDLLE